MSSKLQLIFLFGSISLSVQRQVENDYSKVQQNIFDLTKLIQNLKPHPNRHHDNGDHHHGNPHSHHNEESAKLMNIQTLNMFYRNKDKNQVISDTDNNIPVREVPKYSAQTSDESKDEVTELLNELERELEKNDEGTPGLRCKSSTCRKRRKCLGCGRSGIDKTLRCRTCALDRDEREKNQLRCRGNTCARSYDRVTGDVDDNNDHSNEGRSRNERSEYRCRGNRCGRSRNDEVNILNPLQAKSGKKYKINDDLDAIVLDLSDLDGLLSKISDCKDGKCREKREEGGKQNLAVVENVDLNNLIDSVNSHGNVEAIFVDLSQVENSKDIANYIKNKFSSNAKDQKRDVTAEDLLNYYSNLKREVIDLILSYIKGDSTLKKIGFLPYSLKEKIFNLKLQLQGASVREYQIRNEINRIVFERPDTKVLSHGERNNNIYVPKWLHTAITNSLNNYNVRARHSLLPMRKQQYERIKNRGELWRLTTKPDVGLQGFPFEVKALGLGQFGR